MLGAKNWSFSGESWTIYEESGKGKKGLKGKKGEGKKGDGKKGRKGKKGEGK